MQQPMNTAQMPYQTNMNQMYTQTPTQTQQIQPPYNSLNSNDPYNVMYHQPGLQQYGTMGTNSPAPSSPAPSTPSSEPDPEIEKLKKEIEDIKKTRQQRKLEEHLKYLSVQETSAPPPELKVEPVVRDTRAQSVSAAGLRRTHTVAPSVSIAVYISKRYWNLRLDLIILFLAISFYFLLIFK